MSLLARVARAHGLFITVSSKRFRLFSSVNVKNAETDKDVMAAYLIQNFGFNKESAFAAANRKYCRIFDKSRILVHFLKEQGFLDPQISKVIRRCPKLLCFNPYKCFTAKIEFLHSKFTCSEVIRIIVGCPHILTFSLNKSLIPSFAFLSVIFESERAALDVVSRFGGALLVAANSSGPRNLETLIKVGVPRQKIVKLFSYRSFVLKSASVAFDESLERVKEFGFNPKTSAFISAVAMVRGYSKQRWKEKIDIYQSCGWTEEMFKTAFRRSPCIVGFSEDKIKSIFNVIVGEMGIEPSFLAKYPLLIGFSLEKRVIPRAVIVKVLMEKGKLKMPLTLSTVFGCSEVQFRTKYVMKYDEIPGLMKLYEETLPRQSS